MLLRVEVAAFHSGLNRLVSVALSSSHDAWVLPSTLLCGARTFLWRCRLPATVWPTSRAILAHSAESGLISGTGRRMNDQTVLFQRRQYETQTVLPASRSRQRHPNGRRPAACAGGRSPYAFPRS